MKQGNKWMRGKRRTMERRIMIRTIRDWMKGNDGKNKWDDKEDWKNRERKEDEELWEEEWK